MLVPRMVIDLGGSLVVDIELSRKRNGYLPPITVLARGTNLDGNGCCADIVVGRIHNDTSLYIYLLHHIGTTKYIISLYYILSNANYHFLVITDIISYNRR